MDWNNLIRSIGEHSNLYKSDFLLTWEHTPETLKQIVNTAFMLKQLQKEKKDLRIFHSGLGISIFRDNSTRTRFSFSSAMNALGLGVQELDEERSQISHGETVRETATMISFLAEVIGIRDDIFLGEGDKYQREVSEAVNHSFEHGILAQRPTIINLQSDLDHPTQSLSDLSKMVDYFGGIENLKGKKVAMTWAYSPSYGKPMSVPQGIISLLPRFGMDVTLAYPKGYNLIPELEQNAHKFAQESGSKFSVTNSMEEAFENADVVYPKSWAPFHIMQQRTALLKQQDKSGLVELEKHCLEENKKFIDWECNEKLMALTKDGKALYQHCLPADITGVSCQQGEVSKDVFNRYIPHTYDQASYKPFIIMAMTLLSKIKDPQSILKAMI
jgi:knotted carbamoyltransferase YgeW